MELATIRIDRSIMRARRALPSSAASGRMRTGSRCAPLARDAGPAVSQTLASASRMLGQFVHLVCSCRCVVRRQIDPRNGAGLTACRRGRAAIQVPSRASSSARAFS